MKCRVCGKKLPLGMGVCDNCGEPADWRGFVVKAAAAAGAVIILLAVLIGVLSRNREEVPGETTGDPTATTGQIAPSTQTPTVPTTLQPAETTVPPTTQSTEPSTEPTEPPGPSVDGEAFIFTEQTSLQQENADKYTIGYCYYRNNGTDEVFLICEEQVILCLNFENVVFFVKEAEPNKLYAADITDLTRHNLVYETEADEINELDEVAKQYKNRVVVLLEDNRRVVWLDVETGEASVLIEQHYMWNIGIWGVVAEIDGQEVFTEIEVWFLGKRSADDPQKSYIYNCTTGEFTYQPEL